MASSQVMFDCWHDCKASADKMLLEAGVPANHPILNMLEQFIQQFGPIAGQAILAWILSLMPKPLSPSS